MLYIKIADIIFLLNYSEYDNVKEDIFIDTYLLKYFFRYLCELQIPNYNIKFSHSENYIEKGKHIASLPYHYIYELEKTVNFVFSQALPNASMLFTYTINMPKDWKDAEFIDYLSKEDRLIPDNSFVRLSFGLYFYIQGVLLRHNSFFIHGVALQYKAKGLVFSAASGVGKTTHTNFWAENFGAEILNGDSPIIKLVDGKPFIYGSPWCGTSDISVNKVVPLDAIIIISRGTENRIRKLSKLEAVGYLFPHMKRPAWDAESTNMCLDYCEAIINTISIYKLECLPNSDAAEVARRGIEELNEH